MERIKAAAIILSGYRTEEQLTEALTKLGVESVDDLNPEWIEKGRLLNIVGLDDSNKPTPEIKAKKAVAALYGSQAASASARTELLKNYGFEIKGKDAPSDLLLKIYRPKLTDDLVTQALKTRYGNRKVILFKPGTSEIDVEATLDYIADLDQGLPEQEFVMTSEGLTRPVAVGEKADCIVDEDPLHPNSPLRKDRSTVGIQVNWAGISKEVRQLCRVILDRNEIDTDNRYDVNNLLTVAHKGVSAVAKIYPEAWVTFNELRNREDLPRLRMSLTSSESNNNPFNIGKKRSY